MLLLIIPKKQQISSNNLSIISEFKRSPVHLRYQTASKAAADLFIGPFFKQLKCENWLIGHQTKTRANLKSCWILKVLYRYQFLIITHVNHLKDEIRKPLIFFSVFPTRECWLSYAANIIALSWLELKGEKSILTWDLFPILNSCF